MDEYKIPFSSDLAAALANANEKMLPLIAFADEINKNMEPMISTLKIHQAIFQSNQGVFDQIRLSLKDIYSPLFRNRNALLKASIESSKIALLASQSDTFKYANAVSEMWKANFNFTLNTLSKSDFRIGVVSQELEQVISENPKEVAEKLLFKKIPKPSNEAESQVFKILYEFRKNTDSHENELNEVHKSNTKNVNNQKSNEIHNSPTSYRTKTWYVEQIDSQLIGLVISSIFAITIGVDPAKTIVFALMLSRLLKFLK